MVVYYTGVTGSYAMAGNELGNFNGIMRKGSSDEKNRASIRTGDNRYYFTCIVCTNQPCIAGLGQTHWQLHLRMQASSSLVRVEDDVLRVSVIGVSKIII
jgi:hypothetical protein